MSTPSRKKPEQAALLEVAASEKPEREEQAKGSARYASPRPLREWTPEQGQLLPQYEREVLGEGHLACFFVDVRKALDFSPILKAYTQERGQPPYHPVMMTLLLMYAYARGITSSREIERRCETDIAFRYLTGGEQPDHDTVCTFRGRHLEAFRALFVDTLRLARGSGRQVKNGVLPRFSLRGLTKVRGEFSLACAAHNLKKLWTRGWELPSLAARAA